MKKIYLSILLIILPSIAFAGYEPEASIRFDINTLSCSTGSVYGICGGKNAKLHNTFVDAMKKYDTNTAIQAIDQFVSSRDGSNNGDIANFLINPLIGDLKIDDKMIMPPRILGKKAYKGGILFVGTIGVQDANYSFYYASYMRYKRVNNKDFLYIYNVPLIPPGSTQYNTYTKLYGGDDFNTFERDLTASFKRGKFNNKNVNTIYQDLIKSIK